MSLSTFPTSGAWLPPSWRGKCDFFNLLDSNRANLEMEGNGFRLNRRGNVPHLTLAITLSLEEAGGREKPFEIMERAGDGGSEDLGASSACCVAPDK